MINKDIILITLAKLKPRLIRQYNITKLALVGPFARDEATETSDIDVVADFHGIDIFDLLDIRDLFQESFGKNVDVIVLSPNMNPYLKTKIEKEAIYV